MLTKAVITAIGVLAGFGFLNLTHQSTYYESTNDQGFYWLQSQPVNLDGPYDQHLPGVVDGRVSAMPGYGAFLSVFVTSLGPWGVVWGNSLLHVLTGVFLFLAGRRLVGETAATAALVVWESSTVTIVLSRWLLSENLAGCLLWLTVYGLIRVREGDSNWVVPTLGAVVLFAWTRLEGFPVALTALILIHQWSKQTRPFLYVTGGFLAASVAMILPRGSYAAQNLEVAAGAFLGRLGADALDASVWPWAAYSFLYQALSLAFYGYLPLLVLAVVQFWRKRKELVPLLVGLPYLLFLVLPPSTTNHPTYMRRFWVFLLPATFLLAARWFDQTPRRRRYGLAAAVLVSLPGLFVVGGNEDDASRQVYDLARMTPPGELVVLTPDTNRWAGIVRVAHGPLTVPVGAPLPEANHTILRFNESGVPVRWSRLVVEQHRDYITGPMLEGFSPLWDYLVRDVPPRRWTTTTWHLELVRVHGS